MIIEENLEADFGRVRLNVSASTGDEPEFKVTVTFVHPPPGVPFEAGVSYDFDILETVKLFARNLK